VQFDFGAVALVQAECERLGIRRPLVVTDAGARAAGTGSEVGRAAILILDEGRKVAIISPHVVRKAAICDPELT